MVFSPRGPRPSTPNGSSSMRPSTGGGAGGKESGEGSFPPEKAEVERAAQVLCEAAWHVWRAAPSPHKDPGPTVSHHEQTSLPRAGSQSLSGTASLIPSASVQGPVKTMIISLGRLT